MAFNINNFSYKGPFPGSTALPYDLIKKEWNYSTSDSFPQMNQADYFEDVVDVLRVGDFIYVDSSVSGQSAFYVESASPTHSFVVKLGPPV